MRLMRSLVQFLGGAATMAALFSASPLLAACPGAIALKGSPWWERISPVSRAVAAPAAGHVALTFVGHASFVIESPGGVRAVTDFNDYVRPDFVPDIVTMNNAHSTHFSESVPKGVKHVLRGWGENGEMARHNLQLRDMRIRNVPTNVRDWAGGTRYNGNSIFVFEVADLCVAHLGHLHHVLTKEHLEELGQIDVMLTPVDSRYTMSSVSMIEVIDQVKPRLVIPMHFFGNYVLEEFVGRLGTKYKVTWSKEPNVTLARANLPAKTEVLVLPGY